MKKKVMFIVNYFYPDFASTGQLMTELCLELQKEFEIVVIACQPNYAGESVKGKKKFEIDYLDTIKIVRINTPLVNKRSKFSRFYFIITYFILSIFTIIKEKNVDIVYTISQPPVFGGVLGVIGKVLKKAKLVYNIQDFNPEQAQAINYTNISPIYSVAKIIDKFSCKVADEIILVGDDMLDTLKRRFNNNNVPKTTVINNWVNQNEIFPMNKNDNYVKKFLIDNNLTDKFIVMYSGNLGLYYDLENIIKIAKQFIEKKDIIFVFIGAGAMKEEMIKYVNENNLTNVTFLPYQPKDMIKYSLNAANVHLVVNQKGIKGVSVPSKIYGVMAVGKPIIGVLEQGSTAEKIIKDSRCGKVVEPNDYNKLVDTINLFYKYNKHELEQMGQNGRNYLEEYLKKESSINKYRDLLLKL